MNVSDLMTTPALSCSTDAPCSAAAQLMWDGDCGCVPVTDATGTLAGIVTDRDLCMATHTTGRPLGAIPVARVMATTLRTVRPETPIRDALTAMSDARVHRLPVVDADGRLVGMVTLSDVARHEAKRLGTRAAPALKTLATIHQPRDEDAVVEIVPPARDRQPSTKKKAPAKKPSRSKR